MRKIIPLRIFLLLVFIAGIGLTHAQAASTVVDNFTGTSANLPWLAFNGACLTAGDGTGSIPACKGLPYYGNQIQTGLINNQDNPGSGALRFTNGCANGNCYYGQNGAIISVNPFPSNQGLQITFTTYTYGGDNQGGHGADGIGFYLLNGDQAPNIGSWGGSLGYSCSNTNYPYNGMAGAYLGLGIDEYGNFLNQRDNTSTGYGYQPGRIGLRGYGNINLATLQRIDPSATSSDVQAVCQNGGNYEGHQLPDYSVIPNAYKVLPTSTPIANEIATTRNQATPITYKLILTSNGLLSLSYNWNNQGFQSIISQQNISASNGPMPSSFLFGFGGSTGGSDNVHEITCFEASPSTRATSAPIAPISISSGSYIYSLTSNPDPIAGHVQAFQTVSAPTAAASAPVGTASGPAIWDAGDSAHMPASTRLNVLTSTGQNLGAGAQTGSGPITPLTSLDSAAFNLTNTEISTQSPCVPNTTVITNYTIDPNYTYASGSTTCSYLAGRQSGWMLGGISGNDHAQYLGPPGSANLLGMGGYVSFAQNNNKREQLVLFTSNDGFLYAVDSQTGDLVWGWMPRPFVSNLWNYTAFPTADYFDGGFTTTDAVDTATNPTASDWATYVIGTAEGGAYHYSLKLSSNSAGSTSAPTPTTQTWGTAINITNTITAVSSPQEQAPVIVTFNGSQYALYVVNTTTGTGTSAVTTSTLYEQNVATGKPSSGTAISAALHFVASSSITYVLSTGTVWIGDNNGGVWSLNITGNASADAGNATQVATTSPQAPITTWATLKSMVFRISGPPR
jgi:type IV pilus assembly protein PilY1